MGTFSGFGELRTPLDLVKKLEHDFARIRESPEDQYAAFDFFVSAEHIVDWIHPTDRGAREVLRVSSPLLRITSHLANGGKHFEAKARIHKSIANVEKHRYAETGYAAEDYLHEPLVVHFTAEESDAFGQETIEVAALAEQVLAYWKANVPQA